MLRLLWQLTRGYRLTPWRSPYLRWRLETYWGLHAERITFGEFWRFVWQHRADLWRYIRWASHRGTLRPEFRSRHGWSIAS
ncbi:MAG: hypothetical protein U0Q18_29835 [Bryobacteraceae bacterium]